MSIDPTGHFYWFDLKTPDPAGAIAFFCAVVGYAPKAWPEANYTMLGVGEAAMGGVRQLPVEAQEVGAPAHWVGYIGHKDVDSLIEQVIALGGRSLEPAFDLPNVGRVALLADPGGATFAGFTPADPDALRLGPTTKGYVAWHELASGPLEETWAFYSQLFGWTQETPDMAMGPGAMYRMYKPGGADSDIGGMLQKMAHQPLAAWLYYLNVDDLDGALELVKAHGGQVANGPMEVPGGDRVAQCVDPQGGRFALHQYAG
jgi:uncharacterized protein